MHVLSDSLPPSPVPPLFFKLISAVSPDIYHHAFIWTSVIFLGVLRLMHQIPALWSTVSFLTIHLIIFLTALKNFFNCLPSSFFYHLIHTLLFYPALSCLHTHCYPWYIHTQIF